VVQDVHVVGHLELHHAGGVMSFMLWMACAYSLASRVSVTAGSAPVAGAGVGAARRWGRGGADGECRRADVAAEGGVVMAVVLFCGC
jgi:hypothetical protein